MQVFAASLKDIKKALRPKAKLTIDKVKKALPTYLKDYAQLFLPKEGAELPPHRGPDVDHKIELIPQDGKLPEIPYGPLYSMSRDELLVLRKTLLDLLNKGFIYISTSSIALLVLFIQKL